MFWLLRVAALYFFCILTNLMLNLKTLHRRWTYSNDKEIEMKSRYLLIIRFENASKAISARVSKIAYYVANIALSISIKAYIKD